MLSPYFFMILKDSVADEKNDIIASFMIAFISQHLKSVRLSTLNFSKIPNLTSTIPHLFLNWGFYSIFSLNAHL